MANWSCSTVAPCSTQKDRCFTSLEKVLYSTLEERKLPGPPGMPTPTSGVGAGVPPAPAPSPIQGTGSAARTIGGSEPAREKLDGDLKMDERYVVPLDAFQRSKTREMFHDVPGPKMS